MMRRVLVIVALCLLTACESLPPLPSSGQMMEQNYRLGGGDIVAVTVYDAPQISNNYKVEDDGSFPLALVGNVNVKGLTLDQASTKIADELRKEGYIKDAKVSMNIQKFRPYFIAGHVVAPDQYTYQPGMTIYAAIARAGGYDYYADKRGTVTLKRGGKEYAANVNATLEPDDVIVVPEVGYIPYF